MLFGNRRKRGHGKRRRCQLWVGSLIRNAAEGAPAPVFDIQRNALEIDVAEPGAAQRDLRDFDAELTGKHAQEVLDRAGITTNRNTIPDDPRSAFITSGLRLGSAAETTAGMKEEQFVLIATLMARALRGRDDDAVLAQVRDEVAQLCAAFNPYAGFTKL